MQKLDAKKTNISNVNLHVPIENIFSIAVLIYELLLKQFRTACIAFKSFYLEEDPDLNKH